MPRRRTHPEQIRNRLISIRITETEYDKLKLRATISGLTLSSVAERLVTRGHIVVADTAGQLDPHTLSELRRIGNNLNQIAHAVNSNLPPHVLNATRQLYDLASLLVTHHYFSSRTADARALEAANDSSAPQARDEFQRSAQLHPPRHSGSDQ